jgi:hypothetical protein
MKRISICGLACLLSAASSHAQIGSSVWKSLQQPVFDSEKATAVSNLVLVRDRLRLTFSEGLLQFTQPVNGLVYGAGFSGRGRIQVEPPTAQEAQQLKLHTGQDVLDMEFSEAALVFSDQTFDEVSRQAQWKPSRDTRPAEIYLSRQREREEIGAELVPRLLRSVMTEERSRCTLFAADLKTAQKGWIHIRFDTLESEEISVGQWKDWERIKGFNPWLSFPAGGRTPAEIYKDPLAKDEFRIRGYIIDVEISDKAELSASARVTLDHCAAGARVLVFRLDSRLRIERVSESGKVLEFFQPQDPKDRQQSYGDYAAIVLERSGQPGQRQVLEFSYRGKRVIRRVGQGQYFCESFGWYPTRAEAFSTRADFELNFQIPKKYSLVATGDKVSEGLEGNVALSRWKSGIPLAVAGFAYGDYKLEKNKAGDVEIEIYANRNPDDVMSGLRDFAQGQLPGQNAAPVALGSLSPAAMARTMAQEVANSVNLFQQYFGPYPYKRLAVANIPYSYGQGWPMLLYLSALSFLDSTQRHSLGITGHIQITDFFRAHETSHQWWGHRIGWKSYHDQWLSEGFAQFSGNLYVQMRRNNQEYLTRLREDKQELKSRDQRNRVYESLGPVWMGARLASSDAPHGYSTVVYNKGGYILHMLRSMLFDSRDPKNPERRFIALMKDFCQSYENQPVSTEDFKAMVEKHIEPLMDLDGNGRMDWFFNQYVYGTGIPEYRFTYQVEDAGSGKWQVKGRIVQANVPPGWKNVLPVYLTASGRTAAIGWTRVAGTESSFAFILPMKPDKIALNQNEEILADVKQ